MPKERRRPRTDGFKRIDKIRVESKIEGPLVFDLLFRIQSAEFLVEVDATLSIVDKDIKSLKRRLEEAIAARETVTWERWIQIHYRAGVGEERLGFQKTWHLGESEDNERGWYAATEEDKQVIREISFTFEVFELSSAIALSKEAKEAWGRSKFSDPPDAQRLLRPMCRDGAGGWMHKLDRHDKPEQTRVDADYIETERAGSVFVHYTEPTIAALESIRNGMRELDRKLREVLVSPNLVQLITGLPLALPAAPDVETNPRTDLSPGDRRARVARRRSATRRR